MDAKMKSLPRNSMMRVQAEEEEEEEEFLKSDEERGNEGDRKEHVTIPTCR